MNTSRSFLKEKSLSKEVGALVLKYSLGKEWIPMKIRETIKPILNLKKYLEDMTLSTNDNFVVDRILQLLTEPKKKNEKKKKKKVIDYDESKMMDKYKDAPPYISKYGNNSNERLVKYLLSNFKHDSLIPFMTQNNSEYLGNILLKIKKEPEHFLEKDKASVESFKKTNKSKNKKIVDTILNRPTNSICFLSSVNNDTVVKYLIEHPEKIYYFSFMGNENKIAQKWLFENKRTLVEFEYEEDLGLTNNIYHLMDVVKKTKELESDLAEMFKEYIEEFQHIDDDEIVDFLISYPDCISEKFSSNPNDKAVKYLLENEDLIQIDDALQNTNEKMMDWVLKQTDDISRIMDEFQERLAGNVRLLEKYLKLDPKNKDYFDQDENEEIIPSISSDPYIYEDDQDKIKKILKQIHIPN